MAPSTERHNASIAEFVPELDRLAADVMANWKVPGAALAVVQDGKVALAKAYGQRDVEANLLVARTLVGERVRHVNRIKGLLFAQGVLAMSRCAGVGVSGSRTCGRGDGRPLPVHLKA
jgi:hypothetical protein